ncbi:MULTISPECIES: glycerol dehydratase reactivase beta/small subunit family protein [Prauserella salsuginis group]|uniref:Dehydratase medium subunit n=2 Tax=Prauserella salsuginis group TaxID=2893672 RepID=A0A839XNX6_9PSEU|nr:MULTISPECIES: glycerol dehydratase reactivase beta/small subunit family protein [Prauserella salsuginis group]MBB3662393.1 hypothetical protein [Prauserella sediminis]MCR3720104.1 Dehydratase medium subunit [Prauserella flava]MCR3736350.1 Dehydratase medium subunit [Prauserella salsuginis]
MSGVVDRRGQRDRRSPPAVVAHCACERGVRELLAGLEEEGVPVRLTDGDPGSAATAVELAHAAARESPLDVGVGIDAEGRVCVHHAKRPADRPVVTTDTARARWCGHNAARLVVGLPLKDAPERMEEPWPHH